MVTCWGCWAGIQRLWKPQGKIKVVQGVNVVEAPGITIREHFGHVSSNDGTASLAQAVVKAASEEAYQTPLFDEYVICLEGTIKFVYGEEMQSSVKRDPRLAHFSNSVNGQEEVTI